ncbi:MAG TPA: L-lactate dehydrogenase [Solirubrobacteraceae bacterium]|nr:L-lactate dehydrogenase [Solirubrobacteraceae bacterium]
MRIRPDRSLGLAPATVLDYRELARRRLPRQLFDYIDGGAHEEVTMRANVGDLERVLLRQRVMRDVSVRDPAVEVLGQRLALPVILGPVGLGGMFAPRAEVQAARAAQAAGIPFVESTVSICSIEEVARATSAPPWFQLYVMRNRGYAEELMARAQAVGAPVLILTIDLAVTGARHRDTRNGMAGDAPLRATVLRGLDIAGHPRWIRDVAVGGRPLTFGNLEKMVPGGRTPVAFKQWVDSQFDPSVTWDDLAWARRNWSGKLVVKGVLDAEDARRAVDAGVDGVIVSNHGGRQLDSVPSTTRALPAVVDAVGDEVEVLADGGVRTGLDVVKMVALGARAVLLGRAWAWAVAARGQEGVRHILDVIRTDMDVALALTGQTSVTAVDRSALHAGLPEISGSIDPGPAVR